MNKKEITPEQQKAPETDVKSLLSYIKTYRNISDIELKTRKESRRKGKRRRNR